MAGSDDETTPPGWYRQKDSPGTLRWWDGDMWTDDHMPLPASARSRPSIRIADEVIAAARRPAPAPDPTPAPNPTPEPALPVRRPRSTGATSGSTASGRATGSVRPKPPPGDDRPRTSTWPSTPSSGTSTASHRVVERRSGGSLSPGGKVLIRAIFIFALLGAGFFGYTKIRDAEPGDAQTLSSKPITVDKDRKGARPLTEVVLKIDDLPAGWATQAFDPKLDDICQGRVPRSVLVPFDLQSSSFTQGSAGPFITDVVMRFTNAQMAKDYMELTAETVDACRNYDDNGSTITLKPLVFPLFGDQTFVAKATGTSPYGTVDGDIIYVRTGARVASIQTISFGDARVSNELVAFLTRLVTRRL